MFNSVLCTFIRHYIALHDVITSFDTFRSALWFKSISVKCTKNNQPNEHINQYILTEFCWQNELCTFYCAVWIDPVQCSLSFVECFKVSVYMQFHTNLFENRSKCAESLWLLRLLRKTVKKIAICVILYQNLGKNTKSSCGSFNLGNQCTIRWYAPHMCLGCDYVSCQNVRQFIYRHSLKPC